MKIKNYSEVIIQKNSKMKRVFKRSFVNSAFSLFLLVGTFSSNTFAQQQTVVLTTGSTWTVPADADVSTISVECWGAGGGGAYTSEAIAVGGAGGGGAYAKTDFTSFTVGQTINYVIGTGGAGSTGTNNGGSTWFFSNATGGVNAEGGKGAVNNASAGGAGGSALSSIGDVKRNGGKGGNGSFSSGSVCGNELASGGGGAAAMPTLNGANGGNASTSTGGIFCNGNHSTAGTGGSNLLYVGYTSTGGNGVELTGAGFAGTIGAGGAGGVSATFSGGKGGDGLIVITYTIDCSTTGIDTQVACGSFTWINGIAYTSNETAATHTLVGGSANGCDSTVTLNLTVNTVETSTSQMNGVNLSANLAGGTYQWINCNNNNAPIIGATNKAYTATANGSYAVIVTKNGCTDTSACLVVSTVGIEYNETIAGLNIFPNPTKDVLTVSVENMQDGQYIIELMDATGRMISTQVLNDHAATVSLMDCEAGVYLVRISNGDRQSVRRVIKE